ncbi:MAG: hypothetical protein ABIQ95_15905 [Bdellovibrionia bacterium]
MKTSNIALIVSLQQDPPVLIDTLTSDVEINFLEASLQKGEPDPLAEIYRYRSHVEKQESEFGDYVEELLSKPFLEVLMQRQAVQWLRSKIKMEQFQKQEQFAAKLISDYAYKLFTTEPARNDFFIESTHFRVRVRIFTLPKVRAA